MYLYVFESSLSNVFIQLHKRVFQVELIDIPIGQDDSLSCPWVTSQVSIFPPKISWTFFIALPRAILHEKREWTPTWSAVNCILTHFVFKLQTPIKGLR